MALKQHYVSGQLHKHVPSASDIYTTIGLVLETAFYTQSVQRSYKEDKWGKEVSSVRESVRKKT
jgi:hypothetical protein